MPKDRRYTRKELESLRRADLQSLYKMHGLKGANQTTKSMVDTLVGHFESSAYMSPNRRNTAVAKTGVRKVMVENTKQKGVREMKKRIPAGPPVKAPRQAVEAVESVESVDIVDLAPPIIAEVRTEDIVFGTQAGPSRQNTPTSMLPPALPSSRSGDLSHAAVHQLLKQRDEAWEAKLRAVEQACENRIQDLEKRLEERLRSFSGLHMSASLSAESTPHPQLTLTADTPTNTLLGKRTEREISQTPGAGPSRPSSSPASKRARIEHTEEEDSDAHLPHTPSPPPADPHTPSPGHQGVRTDNSRTPGVGGPDFFPPHFSASKGMDGVEGEISELPYPLFATTPRPSVPLSPTLDVPASAGRNRLAYRAATLTPGRRKPSPAPRAVSEAHKAMTTITESSEPPLSVQLASRRRVASENTPTRLFPQALRGGSVPVSPPQLSPSPSIGATDREGGFTYTPLPPVPRSALSKTAGPRPENQKPVRQPQTLIDEDDITDIEEDDSAELDANLDFGLNTAKRNRTRSPAGKREESPLSPARNYMDVAMFGLMGPSESPGVTQTPGHRTMLGTERYRDTRFGDVPMVQWGSPSVDLGTGTPASVPRRW